MLKDKFNKDEIIKKLIVENGSIYIKDGNTFEFVSSYDDYSKPKLSPELKYKIEEHGKICDYLKELYATKNADYGDSMHPLFKEYGLTAFLILFGTKINRIKTLMNKGSHTYESLEDSLLDLANYALIAVTELRAKNKNNK